MKRTRDRCNGKLHGRLADGIKSGNRVVLHRGRSGRLLHHLCALTIALAASASPLHSQEYFPGSQSGPFFRFDNGAVGTIDYLQAGRAAVEYYDGSGLVTALFDFAVNPQLRAAVTDTEFATPALRVTNCDADGRNCTLQLDVGVTPWQCTRSNGETYNPGATWTEPYILACDMVMGNQCARQQIDGNTFYNYPCWEGSLSNEVTGNLVVRSALPSSDARGYACHITQIGSVPDQSNDACGLGQGYGQELFYHIYDWPTNYADFDRDIALCAADMNATPNCGVILSRAHHEATDNQSDIPAMAINIPANMPPLNDAVPAPAGLTGETMNPGGHLVESSGGSGQWSEYSGSNAGGSSTGGGGGSGGGDTGGGGGDQTTDPVAGDVTMVVGEEAEIGRELINMPTIDQGSSWLPNQCPSDIVMDLGTMGGSTSLISFAPLCEYAGIIRAIVIATAALSAFGIAIGGSRT
jgi:uncharacterized membrane protein YgcG